MNPDDLPDEETMARIAAGRSDLLERLVRRLVGESRNVQREFLHTADSCDTRKLLPDRKK